MLVEMDISAKPQTIVLDSKVSHRERLHEKRKGATNAYARPIAKGAPAGATKGFAGSRQAQMTIPCLS